MGVAWPSAVTESGRVITGVAENANSSPISNTIIMMRRRIKVRTIEIQDSTERKKDRVIARDREIGRETGNHFCPLSLSSPPVYIPLAEFARTAWRYPDPDRKSTRLNSSHANISYA